MKNFINKYKHAWVFIYFIIYVPWYFGLQLREGIVLHDVYIGIDAALPFIAEFIYPYVYWYLFIAGTVVYLFFTHKDEFYKCIAALFIGMTICLIIFTIYPTSFDHRPEVITGNPLTQYLLNFIYTADKSQNVCPSIHVYNSIVCAVALIKCVDFKNNRFIQVFAIISAVSITLSTMFIKQHSIIDALAAGVLYIIMYVLVYKGDYSRLFKRTNH
ncbi:MAG: phosphatase PAP2 family protein [Coprobacillus sp.]